MIIKDNQVLKYLGGDEAVTIPDNITIIKASAFANATLDELTLSESVIELENNALAGIKVLELVIPTTVTTLGQAGLKAAQIGSLTLPGVDIPESFLANAQVETITFTSGMINIGEYAFLGATITNPIVLPEGLEAIKPYAFSESIIGEITFPDSLSWLEQYAFYESKVRIMNFGEQLYNLGERALGRTEALEAINVTMSNPAFYSDDGVLVDNYNGVLVKYPPARPGESYSLPAYIMRIFPYAFEQARFTYTDLNPHVDQIGDYAFKDSLLTTVVLPTNIYWIGAYAFQGAPITDVTILSSAPVIEIGEGAFDTDYLQRIKVNDYSVMQQYQSHYAWSNYIYYFTY